MTAVEVMATRDRADAGTMEHRSALDLPVIEMVRPMPGFPDHTRFALVRLEGASDLCSLVSLDEPELRFLVVPPTAFFPDYAPRVGDDVVADLQIESAADVLVLVVLNAGSSLHDTTANLAAPVLVNPGARVAGQVVLDEPGLPVAASLLPAV